MTTGNDWQDKVGKAWADNYNRTDRALSGLTQHLLERLAPVPGQSIVDVGCGAGELSMALARARPGAAVTGVDISSDLVDAARTRAQNLRNACFLLADAAIWRPDGPPVDLLVSRHGVMFFPDPVGAFANLLGGATDGARLIFSCFRDSAANPWATEPMRLLDLPPSPDPLAPGPFAFADADRVRSILTKAGWRDIVLDPVDFAFVMGMGDDPVAEALQFVSRIGPAAAALRGMDAEARESALGHLQGWVARHRSGNGEVGGIVAFPAAAWLVSARKAG
jgi:SAM-dependent methyltransferase